MNPILQAREDRAEHTKRLMKEYPDKSTVILKTNVVGENKNPLDMRFVCAFFNDLIQRNFRHKIILMGKIASDDGNYCYYVIDEVGTIVKERTINIEEINALGRLIDIDVYYKKPINRQDLSCAMRTCLICDNYAHLCVRDQRHTREEIDEKVKEIICEFLVEYLTNVTIKAIYSELELFPKCGLVSHRDSGCHTDMNYETFVHSAFAIRHDIEAYIKEACNGEINPLQLIKIGQHAEKHMLHATDGVNTHKGLIFLLGVFLPAVTKAIIENKNEAYVQEIMSCITQNIVGDYYQSLTKETAKTNGDWIYLNHHIKGVRGEALQGLQLIFDIPTMVYHDDDIVHHDYLIQLMSALDDTTIIHRTSIERLREIQQEMTDFLHTGGYKSQKERFLEISNRYKAEGISPGGSADMLVIKIIYEDVRHLLKQLD